MSEIDTSKYRQVLGHFPTGVTVVAGMADGEPVGLAIGSFFSVSLDPALVGFCVGTSSSSWSKLAESGSFCVNVLSDDQEDVCRKFAGPERFTGVGWKAAGSGSPLLDGVLAWIDCDLETTHDAGDHLIVVGRVRELDLGHEGEPLVFFRGGYANLA
jgi:3-hydroxy-9,10-secoandrosta-1,3,5(10)-triene-9,17-dione monooxygenase reductase component